MGLFGKTNRINLALQGGGAHGAFTWGVLDSLLEDPKIELGWISATSAGAVNAVAVVAGLAEGGRDGARAKLRQVWDGVHRAGVPDLVRLNPFLFGLTRSASAAHVASLWSPYDFNPLGFDPLRSLLAETIDFEKVRQSEGPELLIAATEVASGRARLFRRRELTIDAVLASCCLPTLHRTIVIDGVAYWDGGFSANPDLVTLALESPVRDTLIVQLNPMSKPGVPKGVREIAGYANRLTFNAPIVKHVEIIETAREALGRGFGRRGSRLKPLARHRFHLIEAGRYTASLSDDSKLKPDLELITYLHGAGRGQAGKWLEAHRAAIGRRSSVDLKARFLADGTEKVLEATGETPDTAQPATRRA